MKTFYRWLSMLLSLSAGAAQAADFNELEGRAFQRPESGWIFAQRVGEFDREENPKISGSSRDGVANYKDAFKNTATVYVYSPQSVAQDSTLSSAKSYIEHGL